MFALKNIYCFHPEKKLELPNWIEYCTKIKFFVFIILFIVTSEQLTILKKKIKK